MESVHLSLLLATIQLPLVSVREIWLPEGSKVTFKCHKHGSDRNRVTVTNNLEDITKCLCCCGPDSCTQTNECMSLKVAGVNAGLHFYPKAKSWFDALEHCHRNHSRLVRIINQTVQQAVDSLLQNEMEQQQDGLWIGLERSVFGRVSDPWKWTTGEEVENPSWNGSTLVDGLNDHCGKIIWVKGSREFKWLDARCHEEPPSICQNPT